LAARLGGGVKAKSVAHSIKTTIALPEALWRAAKIRAMDDRTDLRSVLIAALERYLAHDPSQTPPKKGPGPK
jgi:hypothetical protein